MEEESCKSLSERSSYEVQLKELFDSCDSNHDGLLSLNELEQLCARLQLDSKISQELQNKINYVSIFSPISFPLFKESFINILEKQSALSEDASLFEEFESGNSNWTKLVTSESDFLAVNNDKIIGSASPGREVSPKYVYGSKKYGRKSRPVSLEIDEKGEQCFKRQMSADDACWNDKLHRVSDSDQLILTPTDSETLDSSERREDDISDDMKNHIREWSTALWEKLTKDDDGYIDYEQFEVLCHSLQESNGSTEVCDLLDMLLTIKKWKIDFKTFCSVVEEYFISGGQVQKDEVIPNEIVELELNVTNVDEVKPENIQLTSANLDSSMLSVLDTDHSGLIDTDRLTEILGSFGIQTAARLMENIGISTMTPVKTEEFISMLEEEVSALDECNNTDLLKTMVACFISEVRYSRVLLEQMRNERDKLKQDVIDANQHTSLLAQEMDEHSTKLECRTKTQIKDLKNKHAEEIRELQQRLKVEGDKLQSLKSAFDQELDSRVSSVRDDENKLKKQLQRAEEELSRMEKEHSELTNRLQECDKTIAHQQKQLNDFPELENKLLELECNKMMVPKANYQDLLMQLDCLNLEKKELKDENDELISELSNVKARLLSESAANSGLKRRGSQCSDEENIPWRDPIEDNKTTGLISKKICQKDFGDGGSSCCYQKENENTWDQKAESCCDCTTHSRGIQVSPPSADQSLSTEGCSTFHYHIHNILHDMNDIYKLVKIDYPGDLVDKHSSCVLKQLTGVLQDIIQTPKFASSYLMKILNDSYLLNNDNKKDGAYLACEHKLREFLVCQLNLPSTKNSCCSSEVSLASLKSVDRPVPLQDYLTFLLNLVICQFEKRNGLDKSRDDSPPLSDLITSCYNGPACLNNNEEEIPRILGAQDVLRERDDLRERCLNLENSLLMLKDEYDDCEEYWRAKLDEERDYNDQQQMLTDQRIRSLQEEVDRLQDYDDKGFMLSTIEERDTVEEQVTELEEECRRLSDQLIQLEEEKAAMESDLRSRLYEQGLHYESEKTSLDKRIEEYEFKLDLLTRELNLSMEEMTKAHTEYEHQIQCLKRLCKAFQSDEKLVLPCDCPYDTTARPLSRRSQPRKNPLHRSNVTKSHSCPGNLNLAEKCQMPPLETFADLSLRGSKLEPSESTSTSGISLLSTMSTRLRHQESRCRKLEMAMGNQQLHLDKILLETSRQYREEVATFEKMMDSTKEILHNEFTKYRSWPKKRSCQSDEVLLKELRAENCHLIQALQISRQRHLVAQVTVRKLEEQLALQR